LAIRESLPEKIVNHRKTLENSSITTLVVTFCWLSIFAEGYDLGVYGAVLPALLADKVWSLTPAAAGLIGSFTLFGMMIGNALGGLFADLIGRKKTLIYGIILFSIMMILSTIATSPEMLGLYRFIAGIGLGGVLPTAAALTVEYSPQTRRTFFYTVMFSGYCFGGVFAALTSFFLLEDLGWRIMFLIGAFPLLLVPFLVKFLPESISYLMSRNRQDDAEKVANRFDIEISSVFELEKKIDNDLDPENKRPIRSLFTRGNIRATIFFSLTYFMSMLLVYGLITWLPALMHQAGYNLGSSISFLLVLNLTAAFGAIFAGIAADKWGSKLTLVIAYFTTAVCLYLISIKTSMIVTYVLIGIAGLGTIGSTMILSAYVLKYFEPWNRATAGGLTNGLGRIGGVVGPSLVGILMTLKLDFVWNFYAFAVVGILGALAVFLVPKKVGKEI